METIVVHNGLTCSRSHCASAMGGQLPELREYSMKLDSIHMRRASLMYHSIHIRTNLDVLRHLLACYIPCYSNELCLGCCIRECTFTSEQCFVYLASEIDD